MKHKKCLYCGKTFLNKLAVKQHIKLCKYIPENAKYQEMGDIKDEENKPHFVKLVNPYGIRGKSFSPLLEDDLSHDVTMVSGDGTMVTCHAAMLAASSPYLADLLQEPFRDDENVLIVFQNITAQQMKNLMKFLYGRKVMAKRGEVDDLKIVLEEFQISYNIDIIKNSRKDVQRIDSDNYIEDVTEVYIDKVDMHKDVLGVDAMNYNEDLTYGYIDKVDLYKDILQVDTVNNIKNMTEELIASIDVIKEEYTAPQNDYIYKDKNIKERVQSRLRNRKRKGVSYDNWKSACDYCDLKSQTLRGTMKHVQNDHPELFDTFAKIHIKTQCNYCDKKFLDQKLLYQHKKKLHPQTFPRAKWELYNVNNGLPFSAGRQCQYCPTIKKNFEDYKDHIQKHLSGTDKPFPCDACETKFSRSYDLSVHKKRHKILQSPLLCNLCESSFHTEFDYKTHKRTHIVEAKIEARRRKKKAYNKTIPVAVDPNFSAICSTCGKTYTTYASYNFHIKNAHVDKELLKCPHCPAVSSSFSYIKIHMKLHLPNTLQCEHCPKQFPTRNYLKKHTRSQHLADNQKDFVCSKCGKGFNLKSSYTGHLNMHAGLKPFKCRHCEMCYQNESNRNAHERTIHPHVSAKTAQHHRVVKIS